jgi:hypothetical protein
MNSEDKHHGSVEDNGIVVEMASLEARRKSTVPKDPRRLTSDFAQEEAVLAEHLATIRSSREYARSAAAGQKIFEHTLEELTGSIVNTTAAMLTWEGLTGE